MSKNDQIKELATKMKERLTYARLSRRVITEQEYIDLVKQLNRGCEQILELVEPKTKSEEKSDG
jgi:hypothetical protein